MSTPRVRTSGYCRAPREPTTFECGPRRFKISKDFRSKLWTDFSEEMQMPRHSLQELYVDELRDLYSAEMQIVKALPKMAKASANTQLREEFEEHLRQTSEQVGRLEQIFERSEE